MNSAEWIELARTACTDADVQTSQIETLATWDQRGCANAVYRIDGDNYLKVYGPEARWQYHVESSVLRTLAEQNNIPAPGLIREGEMRIGHPYLFIEGITGSTAEEIWDSLPRTDQLRIARHLGRITKDIHKLSQEDLTLVEQKHGGMQEHTRRYRDRHVANIEASDSVSTEQKRDLIHFIEVEAQEYLNTSKVLTHFDMAHNHVYLDTIGDQVEITGIIDWGESMIGPAEWDIAYLWFWTFSGDREAMRECLAVYFDGTQPPMQFARRCLAAIFYTSSMALLWQKFLEVDPVGESIVTEMTESFFPIELFGHPE